MLTRFDDGNHLFPLNRGKSIQKIFNRFPAFKVIDEILERNARADENWRAAHNFGIRMNNGFEIGSFHASSLQETTNAEIEKHDLTAAQL